MTKAMSRFARHDRCGCLEAGKGRHGGNKYSQKETTLAAVSAPSFFTFDKAIKYNTLLKYCGRNFGSKSKVARKSHVKKNLQAVEDLKKTSDRSAVTSMKKTKKDTKA